MKIDDIRKLSEEEMVKKEKDLREELGPLVHGLELGAAAVEPRLQSAHVRVGRVFPELVATVARHLGVALVADQLLHDPLALARNVATRVELRRGGRGHEQGCEQNDGETHESPPSQESRSLTHRQVAPLGVVRGITLWGPRGGENAPRGVLAKQP